MRAWLATVLLPPFVPGEVKGRVAVVAAAAAAAAAEKRNKMAL